MVKLLEIHEDLPHPRIQLLHGGQVRGVIPVAQNLGVGSGLLLCRPGIQIELDARQGGVQRATLPISDYAGIVPAEPGENEWASVESLELLQAAAQRDALADLPPAPGAAKDHAGRASAA